MKNHSSILTTFLSILLTSLFVTCKGCFDFDNNKLHQAVENGDQELVESLLAKGADVNAREAKFKKNSSSLGCKWW